MIEKVHESHSEAIRACNKYLEKLRSLQDKYGVWEENDDSCVETRTMAKYRDQNGDTQIHYHC